MTRALIWRNLTPAVRQSLVFILAVTIAFGIDYLFNLIAGRLLAPAEFSIIVTLAAIGQIMVVGSRVIQTVTTRFVARFQPLTDGAERTTAFFRSMFRAAWRWGGIATLIALVLSIPMAQFLNIDEPGPVLALTVTTILMVVRPVVGGTLQGLQRFVGLGAVQLVQAGSRLVVGIILILAGWGAFGAMVALPLASGLALIVGLRLLQKSLVNRTDLHHEVTISDFFEYSSYAAAGLIGFALLINMDAILVRRFFVPEAAGNYSAAITLGKVIQFIPLAIIMILFPKTAQRQASRRDPAPVLLPAMVAVTVICGGITLLYGLLGEWLILFTFGREYVLDPGILALVGLAMLVLSLANVWLNYFLSLNQHHFVYLIILAIVIQGLLMFFFHDSLRQLPLAMIINGSWLTIAGGVLFFRGRRIQPVERPQE